MIFSTNEREFLRLAGLADPDWPELRRMGIEAMDWGYMRRMASGHQLGGVVAWRCVDERLDGICPEIVRENCRGYLSWLDFKGRQYVEQAKAAVAPLVTAGIPYIDVGSAPCYALLGMDHWPRTWQDMDAYIPTSRWYEAQAALKAEEFSARAPYLITARDTDSFALEVLTRSPEWEKIEDAFRGWQKLFADVRTYTICGMTSPVPSPELWLWLLAECTYGTICWLGGALPVWALARLANIAGLPDFSWDTLLGRMREWQPHRDEERRILAGIPDRPYHRRGELFEAGSITRILLTVLGWAETVYPGTVPATFLKEAQAEFGSGLAAIYVYRANDARYGPNIRKHSEAGETAWFTWDRPPTMEEWLFDNYGIQGYEARVAAGWWRLADGAEWESVQGRPWELVHMGKASQTREQP